MIFNEKNGISLNLFFQRYQGVGGIMVSIAAFQAVDPGSIPGRRNSFLLEVEIVTYRNYLFTYFCQ